MLRKNGGNMKTKPKFTKEELIYIEKVMDINATFGIDRLKKLKEIKRIGLDSHTEKEIIKRQETDLYEAIQITNKIRDKIENMICCFLKEDKTCTIYEDRPEVKGEKEIGKTGNL
jgi:Fe-S-cluster containining protein